MNLISCHDTALSYEGRTVVRHLNMQVHAGDYLCIVGENGSGKTTLMRALLGLKKPTAGSIIYENGLSQKDIGYMPQTSPAHSEFPATVREVVSAGLSNSIRPFLTRAEKTRLADTMALLKIDDIAHRAYRELSGGQQQRVLLARALCAADKVLLLDEPVAGLDPAITAQLYDTIETLHAGGMTVIMISHDIPAAVKYATHILHLQQEPLFFGTTADYCKTPAAARFLKGVDTRE